MMWCIKCGRKFRSVDAFDDHQTIRYLSEEIGDVKVTHHDPKPRKHKDGTVTAWEQDYRGAWGEGPGRSEEQWAALSAKGHSTRAARSQFKGSPLTVDESSGGGWPEGRGRGSEGLSADAEAQLRKIFGEEVAR